MNNLTNAELKTLTVKNLMKFWGEFIKNMPKLYSEDSPSLKLAAQSVEFHVDQKNYKDALRESTELLRTLRRLVKDDSG